MAGRDLFPDEPIGGKDLFPDEPVGQDLFPESPLPGPLSQLTSAIGRVIDETVVGARDTIDATGFGFKADTAKYFSDHGIVGPKPDDTHGARLLKFTNRMLLEGPVAALDAELTKFARSIGEDPRATSARTILSRSEQLLTRITDNVLPAKAIERE